MTVPAPTETSVLILRTISVERLDGVLAACRDRWPTAKLVVLSNPGRKAELLGDKRVADVITVELGPEGFSGRLHIERSFDAVVVPVGNRSGAGYGNVLRAALGCRAGQYVLAVYARDLRPVSRTRLRALITWEAIALATCLPLAWLRSRLHRW